MAGTIKQRIELDGGKELKRELEEFGAAGRKAFRDLQAAAAEVKGLPAGFFSSLKNAEAQVKSLGAQFATTGKQIQDIGRTLTTALTLPIVGAGAGILKQAADFQKAMNSFAVNAGVAGQALSDAEKKAQDLGQASVFSSSEAAEGMTELAKVGLDFQTIMQGAAKAMVDLAAANDTGLASSAAVVGDVINQFKLSASQLPGIVDSITGATVESKLSFDDYALAIGQAGGAAGALGVKFEEFNAVLAATASSFASGSDAGTSFKTFLTRLVPQSKQAAAMMEKLGLKFFDASGKMKSMSQIAQELQDKLGKLSQEDLNDAVSTIFGTDALRTAIALMKQGGAGIDAMMMHLKNTNSADIAATRVKGLVGELDQFNSAVENLSIAIGKSGFLDFVTNIVIKLTDWAQALSQLSPEVLRLGTVVSGVVATIGPFLFGLGLATRAFGVTLQGLGTLIAGLRNLAAALLFVAGVPELAALTLIGVAIGVWATRTDEATAALQQHEKVVNEVDAAYQKVGGSLAKMTQEVKDRLLLEASDSLDKTKQALVDALADLSNKLPHFEGDMQNAAAQAMFDLAKQFQDGKISVDEFNKAIARIGAENPGDVAKLAQTWLELTKNATDLTAKTNEMADRVAWLSGKMSDQAFQAAQAARGIDGFVAANKNAVADTQALGNAADETGKKIEGLSHQITVFRGGGEGGKLSSEVFNVVNGVAQQAEQSKKALDDVGTSAKTAGDKVKQVADDIASHIRTVPDAFKSDAVKPAVDGVVNDLGRIKPAADAASTSLKEALTVDTGVGAGLAANVDTAVNGVVTSVQKLGPAATEAVSGLQSALNPGDVGGGLSADISTTVDGVITELDKMPPAASSAAAGVAQPFQQLPGIFSSIFSGLGALIQGGFGNLSSVISSLASQIRTEINSIISALREAVAQAQQLRAQAGGSSSSGGGSQGGFAGGGYLANGPGTPTSDSIPIMASVKEFIMQAKATAYYGPGFMHALNQMKIPREFFRGMRGFNIGGMVDGFNRSMSAQSFAGGGTVKPLAPAVLGSTRRVTEINLRLGPSRAEVFQMIADDSVVDRLARWSVSQSLTKA
ncbi:MULTISPECIES: phage tail tape measure protein [unclassified Mesorhizobium]|uniref:phage tail tape measure protein n=3 Tax=Mesorhizobium TaxID=68287 RepID=UPI000FCCAB3B|nr:MULTISPECIES: phage tail tape measure protein [unclassified Mesorhizobium]TGP24987.1 phage tail tape measure protein [Mesorhizobium sp. M1D.F.Ca.ET.231.01.1.1]TGP36311.1 phage tail tape measure protein [Mesorhizobium sp. M1D.F.Ca.ET.234.01.1.1]TGS49814.1 phage tail tape measure protein [Mesorhizobium sp. M1D.F.Ca.ET.184.01.1.1]TGS64525.1 phage tail tape measure protein [Mesorhizobium sp. M1D.F.Ca.ET.183.01.1.1]